MLWSVLVITILIVADLFHLADQFGVTTNTASVSTYTATTIAIVPATLYYVDFFILIFGFTFWFVRNYDFFLFLFGFLVLGSILKLRLYNNNGLFFCLCNEIG
jgi:hypothetical protein